MAVYYKDRQFPKRACYEGDRDITLKQAENSADGLQGKLDMSTGE